MCSIVFTHEGYKAENLYPFSLTTPAEDLPLGMLSNKERWQLILKKYCRNIDKGTWFIPAQLVPTKSLCDFIGELSPGSVLQLGIKDRHKIVWEAEAFETSDTPIVTVPDECFRIIEFGWHLFEYNKILLELDFDLLTEQKQSAPIPAGTNATDASRLFIEEGAEIHFANINAKEGPVYIAKGALVMEGTCIRGPVYIGAKAVVKMGAKIYGATTIGASCTVGGEIKNCVIFPFSNKAHDGYLGDSVIGHWCNIGGGTSNSNFKNTAGNISVNLPTGSVVAGKKCGVLMGDYTKVAINISITTGALIGVCANVFGIGPTPKHIPSFSWGFDGSGVYDLHNALEHTGRWMETKQQQLSSKQKEVITNIYNQTKTTDHA